MLHAWVGQLCVPATPAVAGDSNSVSRVPQRMLNQGHMADRVVVCVQRVWKQSRRSPSALESERSLGDSASKIAPLWAGNSSSASVRTHANLSPVGRVSEGHKKGAAHKEKGARDRAALHRSRVATHLKTTSSIRVLDCARQALHAANVLRTVLKDCPETSGS